MNLQQIRRVMVCAALIALSVAGAGWFPTQPVAGQESTLHGAAALDQLKQTGQYDSLQAAINQARFNVKRTAQTPLGRAAWHAPNPAAGYDAYVTEAGVSIALNGAVNDESYVSLSLHSLGYGAALQAVGPGEVSGDQQTINLMRDGVQEWYVNGPDGLEHGFTLAEPPGGAGARPTVQEAGVPLRLALLVSDGWRAVASEDGQSVTLRGPRGEAVEYGKLAVRDSAGRGIAARLTVAGEQVVIEVEDHDAEYPLTIDPLFTLQQKLLAADGAAGDYFGYAVALSGNTAVIGATLDDVTYTDQGSAYVFVRNGATWTLQQKLTANDGAASDYFGLSVALDGDTLVVGAYRNAGQGSAYVFTRSGTVWTLQQKLTANDGSNDDRFGIVVALGGDTLAVGAPGDDIGGNADQGSAYVFTRSGTNWTQQQKLHAVGAADKLFGWSVALSGDTMAVGATGQNIGQGSVYVFTRSGPVWALEQKLTASDGAFDDQFGQAVALSSNTLAVGVPNGDIGANANQGSVYVFTRNGTVWVQSQKLTTNDGAFNDHFGHAVALNGGTLIASAWNDTIGANQGQGSAYVFTFAGGWFQQQKLIAGDGAAEDYFGVAVALSGNTVLVGAAEADLGMNADQGSVYVFVNPICPTLTLAPASLPNGVSGAFYQRQMTVSGGAGPFQFAVVSGVLPPGLSLSSAGFLAGTLTTQGTYQFTLSATNLSSLCSAVRAYTITVTPPCSPITLAPPGLPRGVTGTAYNETLTATGGWGPYTFSVKDELPAGLNLSADGVLSGTPSQAGGFNFTLLARDARGCGGARAYTLTIVQGDIEIGVAPRVGGDNRRVVDN